MRNKIIAAAVAGGLLVGAGFVTAIVSAPAVAEAQEETGGDEERGMFHRGLEFLSDVLADLVSSGEIDQSDADAVLGAVETKAEEVKAEREALRELTKELLDDDVITSAEAQQLPEDHPFLSERFDEAWEDGELSKDEIRAARPHHHRGAFERGARLGALMDDGGIDQAEYDEVMQKIGDDHPLADIDVTGYFADDDLITWDELREIHQELHGSSDEDTAA